MAIFRSKPNPHTRAMPSERYDFITGLYLMRFASVAILAVIVFATIMFWKIFL